MGTKGAQKITAVRARRREAARAARREPDGWSLHEVTSAGDGAGGLILHVGDAYRIIGRAGELLLIEVLGDAHNPYSATAEFLRSVSAFDIAPPATRTTASIDPGDAARSACSEE